MTTLAERRELEKRNLKRKEYRFYSLLVILAVSIFIVCLISVNTGYIKLAPMDVFKTLLGRGSDRQSMILFDFRLPRITISILIGASLAVSGAILQGIARNALADPGLLGINAGAGLMVMLYTFFFGMSASRSIFLLPVLALIGAGLTAALIYILAYKKTLGISSLRLILSGIGVAAGISAAMTILTIQFNPKQYQFIATWLAGSIWGTSWTFVLALLPWVAILLPYTFLKSNVLNALSLTETSAMGIGVNVQKEQIKLLAAAVGLAASAVSVSGGIGFIGLIAPHIARSIVGPRHQKLLPVSAMFGALLVIIADTLGRWILEPNEIPAGTVVAIIGAPYFIYLLLRSK